MNTYLIAYVSEGMNLEEDTKYVAHASNEGDAVQAVYDFLCNEDDEFHYKKNATYVDFRRDYAVLMYFGGPYLGGELKIQMV
jgi:hypothetical protein